MTSNNIDITLASIIVKQRDSFTIGCLLLDDNRAKQLFIDVCDRLDECPNWLLEGVEVKKSIMTIYTPHGLIKFYNDVDRMRGMTFNTVVVDECISEEQLMLFKEHTLPVLHATRANIWKM